MNKVIIFIVILVIIVAIIALSSAGNYLYNLAINSKYSKDIIFNSSTNNNQQEKISKKMREESRKWLKSKSNYRELYLISNDGLKLYNYEIINKNVSNKWVITVHGYTTNGEWMSPYVEKFYNMGYNIIAPDLRGHGNSEGNYIGMGWDDRKDIINIIDYIVEKDSNAEIVLFGVSMGAATVMMVSGEKIPVNVKAIIEDCGYTSAWEQFSCKLKTMYRLPEFPMMYITNVICKIKSGYFIKEASAIEQVKKSVTPIMFIHGDSDGFVPYFMLDKLYDACDSEKEKLVIKGATHAKAAAVSPEIYWANISKFINRYL